jgi:hypothetical protein
MKPSPVHHRSTQAKSRLNGDSRSQYRVGGEALIATYIAGSLTIALLVPYRSSGFLGIPASFFADIADLTQSQAGPFIIYSLFFLSTVLLAGLRLLIGFETLEDEADFEELVTNSQSWRRVAERSVRIMTLVFVEALLLFAKIKGPGVIVALVAASTLAVFWDFLILRMAAHSPSSENVKSYCRSRAFTWMRWDMVCVIGPMLCLTLIFVANTWLRTNSGPSHPFSAQEVVLVAAAFINAAFTLIAFTFELLDNYSFYRHCLKVALPLSTLLAFLFLTILVWFGTPLEALAGLSP